MSVNKDRARSKLLTMTKTRLEKIAKAHDYEFDLKGRRRISCKEMAHQLADVDSVVEELG